VQIVVVAYETGIVRPGGTHARSEPEEMIPAVP
jgi:hypothetical protein